MIQFVQALTGWIMTFVHVLQGITVFSFFTAWDMMISFVVICMVTSIFWKGAKA